MARRRKWTTRRVQRLLVTLVERGSLTGYDMHEVTKTARRLQARREFVCGRVPERLLTDPHEDGVSALRSAIRGDWFQ